MWDLICNVDIGFKSKGQFLCGNFTTRMEPLTVAVGDAVDVC